MKLGLVLGCKGLIGSFVSLSFEIELLYLATLVNAGTNLTQFNVMSLEVKVLSADLQVLIC